MPTTFSVPEAQGPRLPKQLKESLRRAGDRCRMCAGHTTRGEQTTVPILSSVVSHNDLDSLSPDFVCFRETLSLPPRTRAKVK